MCSGRVLPVGGIGEQEPCGGCALCSYGAARRQKVLEDEVSIVVAGHLGHVGTVGLHRHFCLLSVREAIRGL